MVGRRALTKITLQAAADPNMTPGTFGLMLDQAVQDHTQALLAISPSSAAKIQASLALAANSQVQTFSRNFATRELKLRKNESLANVNEIISAGEATVFAHAPPIPGEPLPIDPVTGLPSKAVTLKEKLQVDRDRLRSTLELGGHDEPKIKTALETFDKKVSNAKIAVVSNYASSDLFFDDPLGAYKQFKNKNLPPRIQSLMNNMNPVELKEATQAFRSAIQQSTNMVQMELNVTTRENKQLTEKSEADFSRGIEDNDLEVMETAAGLMRTVDGNRATAMKKLILARAGALVDNQEAEQELVILQANNNLSLGEINKRKGLLTQDKISEFIGNLKDQRTFKMKEALKVLKGQYRPDLETPLNNLKGEMLDNTTKYLKAQQILSKARRAFEKLKADDPAKLAAFEPQDLVTTIIEKTDREELLRKRSGLEATIARAAFLPEEMRTLEGMQKALHLRTGGTFGTSFGDRPLYNRDQRNSIEDAIIATERLRALGGAPK